MAGVEVSGFRETSGRLRRMARGLAAARKSEYVGTVVWYAHFPEFGTASQPQRSYLRPAVSETAADYNSGRLIGGKRSETEMVLTAPDEHLIGPMARAVQRRAKRNAREQGLIETGDLVRSIERGRSVRDLIRRSKAKVQSPRNF